MDTWNKMTNLRGEEIDHRTYMPMYTDNSVGVEWRGAEGGQKRTFVILPIKVYKVGQK